MEGIAAGAILDSNILIGQKSTNTHLSHYSPYRTCTVPIPSQPLALLSTISRPLLSSDNRPSPCTLALDSFTLKRGFDVVRCSFVGTCDYNHFKRYLAKISGALINTRLSILPRVSRHPFQNLIHLLTSFQLPGTTP